MAIEINEENCSEAFRDILENKSDIVHFEDGSQVFIATYTNNQYSLTREGAQNLRDKGLMPSWVGSVLKM